MINFPEEIKQYPQWVLVSKNKIPLIINNRGKAEPVSPTLDKYLTFEEALNLSDSLNYGIGFILTRNDPFCCIDLDVKDSKSRDTKGYPIHESKYTSLKVLQGYLEFLKEFDSYTELSQSGKGLHIWVKAAIPKGINREGVEIYSSDRLIICTGDCLTSLSYSITDNVVSAVVLNNSPKKVVDLSVKVGRLYESLKSKEKKNSDLVEIDQTESDSDIFSKAVHADNAEKFKLLCDGKWEELGYPSQSEADLSLMSMFCFYSQSNEQCRRLFRCTNLGIRQKATKDNRHLDYMLRMIRGRQAEEALAYQKLTDDISQQMEVFRREEKIEQPKIEQFPEPEIEQKPVEQKIDQKLKNRNEIDWPPGFVGFLAKYLYDSSVRPVKEVAITAALGFMAGLCGKAYHIPKSGLNLYIVLIAKSAIGKEALHGGISELANALAYSQPQIFQFFNHNNFASEQALTKACAASPSFVQLTGELGQRFKAFANEKINERMRDLRALITNLYQKSGPGSTAGGIEYSKKDENVSVGSVAYSLVGESTPTTFYDSLTQSMMEDGFLSRFLIIEYNGQRPPTNYNMLEKPPENLIDYLSQLTERCINLLDRETSALVEYSEEVRRTLEQFDKFCDTQINKTDDESYRQMWNRAHLKVLRLSSLLAVGDNFNNPVVTKQHTDWAINLVLDGIRLIKQKIDEGDVGGTDESRIRKIKDILIKYAKLKYKVDSPVLHQMMVDGVISKRFIDSKIANISSFISHRGGKNVALTSTLNVLLDMGFLIPAERRTVTENYGNQGLCYLINLQILRG